MDYMLKGTPGSRGYGSGRALVVSNMAGEVPPARGAVLVMRFPVPTFATLLNQAEALVCAYGSPQALLVELAQQFGIPAVVNLGETVSRIGDGEWLYVDGGGGIVSTFDQRGVWQISVSGVVRIPPAKDGHPRHVAV